MPTPFLTVAQLLEKHPAEKTKAVGCAYKFVQIKDEYRFVEITFLWTPSHSDLVADKEVAQSAGMLYLRSTFWEMTDAYSMTLKIGATEADYENLTKLFEREERPWTE